MLQRVTALVCTLGIAQACSFLPPGPICAQFESIPVAFIGQMVSLHKDGRFKLERFQVIESIKGLPDGTQEVWVDSGSLGACPSSHSLGEQYLIVGRAEKVTVDASKKAILYQGFSSAIPEGFRPEASVVVQTLFNMSAPVDDAADDIAFLRAWKSGRWSTSVIGEVYENGNPYTWWGVPVRDAAVRLTGAGGGYRGMTGTDGRFAIGGVAPGTYRIAFERADLTSTSNVQEVSVPRIGCGYTMGHFRTNGRIQLRVKDRRGNPAANVEVRLIPEVNDKFYHRASKDGRTGNDGMLVVEGLASGSYVIAVNHDSAASADNPYPTTYFPGVSALSQARRVLLAPNAEVKGLVFVVPDAAPTRRITVHVVDREGKAVQGATVFTRSGSDRSGPAYTNSNGEAELLIVSGTTYSIEGWKEFDGEGKSWQEFKRWRAIVTLPASSRERLVQMRFTDWKLNADWDKTP